MTKLELAFAEAAKLPLKEQDRLAEWLLLNLPLKDAGTNSSPSLRMS